MNYDLISHIRDLMSMFGTYNRRRATENLEYELEEMEFVFANLIYSSLIGLPGMPEFLAVELLPCMGRELCRFEERAANSGDKLAELFSKFNFD